jgi:hypothetical protein
MFMDLYMLEMETEDGIDDYIDDWHNGISDLTLAQYLGMSDEEYSLFAESGGLSLKQIKANRQNALG